MPEQPAEPFAMSYADVSELAAVRAFVRSCAATFGLSAARTDLLLLAVNELATNTVQHTTGGGRIRVWTEAGQIVCDVLDRGPARRLGRAMPPADSVGGRGLAIVERICDDVSTRTGPEGTVVRLSLRL